VTANTHVFGPEKNHKTKTDWGTPQGLFDAVNKEFQFVLDAAAHYENAKCEAFYELDDNALILPWTWHEGAVWLNPPYGRSVGEWIEKAYKESCLGVTVVVLIFVRSDTAWWDDWAMRADEIRFIKGRIKFEGAPNSAPAPSCLLIFRGDVSDTKDVPTFSMLRGVPRK